MNEQTNPHKPESTAWYRHELGLQETDDTLRLGGAVVSALVDRGLDEETARQILSDETLAGIGVREGGLAAYAGQLGRLVDSYGLEVTTKAIKSAIDLHNVLNKPGRLSVIGIATLGTEGDAGVTHAVHLRGHSARENSAVVGHNAVYPVGRLVDAMVRSQNELGLSGLSIGKREIGQGNTWRQLDLNEDRLPVVIAEEKRRPLRSRGEWQPKEDVVIPDLLCGQDKVTVVHKGRTATTEHLLEGCLIVMTEYDQDIVMSHFGPGNRDHVPSQTERRPSGQAIRKVTVYCLDKSDCPTAEQTGYQKTVEALVQQFSEQLGIDVEIAVDVRRYQRAEEVVVDWSDDEGVKIYTQDGHPDRLYPDYG